MRPENWIAKRKMVVAYQQYLITLQWEQITPLLPRAQESGRGGAASRSAASAATSRPFASTA
jgi:hypothetical protein